VTSTLGAFFFVLFATYQRELNRGRKPQLNYNSIMGIPLLPYVHIPSESLKKENVFATKAVVEGHTPVLKKKSLKR